MLYYNFIGSFYASSQEDREERPINLRSRAGYIRLVLDKYDKYECVVVK